MTGQGRVEEEGEREHRLWELVATFVALGLLLPAEFLWFDLDRVIEDAVELVVLCGVVGLLLSCYGK